MRVALGILVAVLLLIPRTSLAQPSDEARILVDVNLGTAASLAKDRQFQSRFVTFSEAGSSFAAYPKPSANLAFVDVGGTFMLTRLIGVGVSYSRTKYEDVAELRATVPHPTFFNAATTTTNVTGERLTRTEGVTNVFAVVAPVRTSRLEWRVIGGPSYFSLKADMVKEILYVQTHDPASTQQTITINGFTTSQVKASKLGFHVGSDVTFFLTEFIGVGGGVRFSQATVTVDQEPLSNLSQDIRVGSTQVFFGARFRFGG